MKKVIPLLLSLVLALSVFTLPSFGTDAVTMIDDFEDGGIGYWSSEFTTEAVSTVAKNGSKSLKAAYTTQNVWNNPSFQNASALSLSVGDKTHISVWVKTEATVTTASFGFRVHFVDSNGVRWYNNSTSVNFADTNAGWVKVDVKLTDATDGNGTTYYDPTADGAGTLNSIFFAPYFSEDLTNNFVMYLDDLSLTKEGADAPTGPVLIDGFEDDGATLADGYWSSEFTTEKVSTAAKNGSKSLKAAYTTANQWHNPSFQTAKSTLGISVGDNTHFSVWVKTDATATTTSFGFRVRFVDGAGKTWYNYNTNLNFADTNAGFVQVNLELTDFLDYADATGTVKYDPTADGASTINSIVFAPLFTEELTNNFVMYLDDLSLTKESAPAPTGPVLIDGFEEGGIGYWSGNYIEYDVDATVAKNGSNSLKLVKDNASPWPELHTATGGHNIAVGDNTYIATWVKTDGAGETGSFEFRYQIVDSTGKKWYNYNTRLNIVSTEEDFVMAAAKLSDFMDYDTGTVNYDPTAEGAGIIDKFVIVLNGTPATTFNVWLDDIQLIDDASVVAPPTVDEDNGDDDDDNGNDEPIEIPDPTIDTTGTLEYLQNFEDIDDVADSGFNFEVSTHGTLSIETNPEHVHDGDQSLRIDFNGSAGYTSIQALCEDLRGGEGVDLTDYTHLEIWMKTSVNTDSMIDDDGNLIPFNVRQRFNIEGSWWYYAKDIYPIHTNEGFVQYRIALTDLMDYSGFLTYDAELIGTNPWMYQFDFTTPAEPFTIWIDSVALVTVDPSEVTDGFTVSFNSMGGSAVAEQVVAANGKATKPADPTRDGYVFDGWTYEAADGTFKAYDFSTPVTADLELRATWKVASAADDTNSDTNGGDDVTDTSAQYVLLPVMLMLVAVSGAVIVFRRKKSVR